MKSEPSMNLTHIHYQCVFCFFPEYPVVEDVHPASLTKYR